MMSQMFLKGVSPKCGEAAATQDHSYGTRELGFSRQGMQCRAQAAFVEVLGISYGE
jgi:hypothetical protein